MQPSWSRRIPCKTANYPIYCSNYKMRVLSLRNECKIVSMTDNDMVPFAKDTLGEQGAAWFSGRLRPLAALSSLPGGSPAAPSAWPGAESAPEKLRWTCQREKPATARKRTTVGWCPPGTVTPPALISAAGRRVAPCPARVCNQHVCRVIEPPGKKIL